MKIYDEIVIDMNPESSTFGETLYEDSFQYFGDLYLLQDEDEEEEGELYAPTPMGGAGTATRSSADLGGKISTSRTITSGLDPSLQKSLTTYLNKASKIKDREKKKSLYILDRFDGGLNLSTSPRDLSFWESPWMDELMPSKAGRLVRLGDFKSEALSLSSAFDSSPFDSEGYGLYHFSTTNIFGTPTATGSLAKCVAYQDSGDIKVRDLTNSVTTDNVVDTTNENNYKPVFHSNSNRIYVSDASLTGHTSDKTKNTQMFGVLDKLRYFPKESVSGDYNLGENDGTPATYSVNLSQQPLIQTAPTMALTAGNVQITTDDQTSHGVWMKVAFDAVAGTGGWTSPDVTVAYHYVFYASYLYDEGAETEMTQVSASITSGVTTANNIRKLVIEDVTIDWDDIATTYPRVHGCRFYYRAYTDAANTTPTSSEAYLFAELDFRYGMKLEQVGAGWHEFSEMSGTLTAITLAQTAGSNKLSIEQPPIALTYFSVNLFNSGEIKKDLMWKTSTMGNGVAYIGNIKYDFLDNGTGGRHYPTTMLYCGAGETSGGPIYPMYGVFPVDSNRIDVPGGGGEITALVWYSDRVLQFRETVLYVVNVQDPVNPVVEGRFQGMGVSGQYAVTRTPNGVALVNSSGVYEYNGDDAIMRSLTAGTLDASDFNADSTSKIGYDDRTKMLVVGNYSQKSNEYHYAYSYATDSWCTWNANAATYSTASNFDIDHDGYLTGAVDSSTTLKIYKWSDPPTTTPSVEYITKDIDFDSANLDKRLFTLYISFTGGTSNAITVSFRANGAEGSDRSSNWITIGTIQDYTDPYGTNTGSAWATSGSPTTGDPVVPTTSTLASTFSTTQQKLAKVNFRDMANATSSTLPKDYFKFVRSIQLRFSGTASTTFEINDISLVYKEKRLK